MEITAKVRRIEKNITGEMAVTFETLADISTLGDMQGDLIVKISRPYKKRSLDANSYAWALMTKIAAAVKTSKEEVYEECLHRYGVPEMDADGNIIHGNFPNGLDVRKIPGHWYIVDDLGAAIYCVLIKGSSEYSTVEMAHFIDGVISEAKELGIETLTPAELDSMKKAWHP